MRGGWYLAVWLLPVVCLSGAGLIWAYDWLLWGRYQRQVANRFRIACELADAEWDSHVSTWLSDHRMGPATPKPKWADAANAQIRESTYP